MDVPYAASYIVRPVSYTHLNPEYPRWNRKRIEDVCWELLMNGYLNCEDIIDPVVPFEECAEGFCKYVDQHPESSIKMGVDFS